MNINNDDAQYEVLKAHQDKYVNGNDTCKDLLPFPIKSIVAMHCEDGVSYMHGVIKKLITAMTIEGDPSYSELQRQAHWSCRHLVHIQHPDNYKADLWEQIKKELDN